MFYTQRDLGWIFNWKKVKRVIKKNFDAKEFFYYTSLKKGQKKGLYLLKQEISFLGA